MRVETDAASMPSPVRAIDAIGSGELAARLTCLLLLLSPIGDWTIQPPVLCLAGAGLLISGLWRSPWLWVALTALSAARALLDWPLADNHAYLLAYWCLALALAMWFGDMRMLARNARLLIGLTFALAAWQKWFSPDYLNDVFFLNTFLLDDRFEDFAVLLTPITYEQIDLAREYLEGDYRHIAAGRLPFELPSPLLLLAHVSTLWNLADQSLVALAFLVPPGSRLGRLRDPLLLVFCFTTYAVAPVPSFGWLLLAMGVAQADQSAVLRRAYLAAFAALIVYDQISWASLLVNYFELG